MTYKYLLISLIADSVIGAYFLLQTDEVPEITQEPEQSLSYVALGDSYTIGDSVNEAERWPNQLVSKLKSDGTSIKIIANPSRTGFTTLNLLDSEIQSLRDSNPDIVSVQIGVNDYVQGASADDFRKRFISVLDTVITEAPNAQIFVVTIPDFGATPAGSSFGSPDTISIDLIEYNRIIIEESEQRNLPVVNIFEVSQLARDDVRLVADDGLHPSAKQYSQWVELIYPEVANLLEN